MKGARGLLCAAVLLPALLLTGCYKDLEKVRIKPFRPDLVVPLAAADSITVADMLLRDDDMWALDTVGSNGRVQFTYLTRATTSSSLKLGFADNVLTVEKVGSEYRVKENLFADENHGSVKAVKTITFEQGASLRAIPSYTLKLKDGSTLPLDNSTFKPLSADGELDFSDPLLSDGQKFIFEKPEEKCVKSAVVTLKDMPNTSTMNKNSVKLGLYEGLLWYSGELTDPKVAVTVKREGWLKDAVLEYWMEDFYFMRKLLVGKEPLQGAGGSSQTFPFYKEGDGKNASYHAPLAAGVDSVSETYAIAETKLNTISKDWPISFSPGTLGYDVKSEVIFTKGASLYSKISASVALKLPLTGKFHALVREFKAGDADGVVLPDVNELLLKDKEKKDAAVKMKLTDQDTVLLHFYFVNGTPFEVYLAARVAGKNVAERGKPVSSLRKASEIEQNGGSTAIDDKVGDFGFFEAVGAAAIDADQRGITKVGGASKKQVTLAIPYSLYEEARKAQSGEAKRLRAMLLFRSPGNSDPQEVSPRMSDYLSVRLGVEVKPELEIELINKK